MRRPWEGGWSERSAERVKTNECVNTVESTFHVVICLFYTHCDFQPQPDFHPSFGKQISSYVFIPSECKHLVASSNPSANIFRNVYLASAALDLFPLPCFFKSFASSFQTFPCLVKFVVVENAFYRTFLTSSFC